MPRRSFGFIILRLVRRCLLGLFFGIFLGLVWYQNGHRLDLKPTPSTYQRQYNTFAHRILDFEAERFPIPDSDYALIDRIITSVKKRTSSATIVGDLRARERQVRQILHTIDDVLVEERFIFPPKWDSTVSEGLRARSLSAAEVETYLALPSNARRKQLIEFHRGEPVRLMACAQGSMLYLGIAQEVGLELRLVEAPRHIFCRAKVDDKHWINWDTNEGESYSDQDYARSCGVQPQQIADGIYLSSFVDDRTMSMAYVGRGLRLAREGRFSEAADDLRHALDLDPKSPIAASSLSFVYSASPLGVGAGEAQKNETLLLANRAVALDPNLGCVQESLAAALAESGDFPGAVSAAGRAVELARPDERHGAMQLQEEFLAGRTVLQGMRHHAPVFFWLMYERGWVVCVAVVVLLFVLKALFRPSASDAQPAPPPQFAPPAPAPLEGRLVYPEEMAASAGNVLPLPPPLPPQ